MSIVIWFIKEVLKEVNRPDKVQMKPCRNCSLLIPEDIDQCANCGKKSPTNRYIGLIELSMDKILKVISAIILVWISYRIFIVGAQMTPPGIE